MGTRSLIAAQNAEGSAVKFIYCHWDGYPSYNGKMLINHYTEMTKVRDLLNLGDISSLNERLAPNEDEIHSFEKPAQNVTVAYARDRGETGVDPKISYRTVDEFVRVTTSRSGEDRIDYGQEYVYIFRPTDDGTWKWFVVGCYNEVPIGKESLRLVEDVLKTESE